MRYFIRAVGLLFLVCLLAASAAAQRQVAGARVSDEALRPVLRKHKELVSIPNLPTDPVTMQQSIDWVDKAYRDLGFTTTQLPTSTLPILLAEQTYDTAFKTVLVYFHIDGQPVNPAAWNQEDPFTPVLKARSAGGDWEAISWDELAGPIDDEWRVFGRAAADDKAPILMLYAALERLAEQGRTPTFNLKILFDPEEEYGSKELQATLSQYQDRYASDYFIVMDGPAHESNRPTLTFGCRGIATCALTTYGAALPQHSGHMGNYVPNPVYGLARLLASLKDEQGRVQVADYYADVALDSAARAVLASVPYDSAQLVKRLAIHAPERVGRNYQEALQYPTLNVRQLETSWAGPGLKTVIPNYARAHLDLRLVPETDGRVQVDRLHDHLEGQGYLVLEGPPSDSQRLAYPRIASLTASRVLNAFRTDPEAAFGRSLRAGLTAGLGEPPVVVRMMGGTVPIVPLIEALGVPTVIMPMVNVDNNQHAPNENIRIGNLRQGIAMCEALLTTQL